MPSGPSSTQPFRTKESGSGKRVLGAWRLAGSASTVLRNQANQTSCSSLQKISEVRQSTAQQQSGSSKSCTTWGHSMKPNEQLASCANSPKAGPERPTGFHIDSADFPGIAAFRLATTGISSVTLCSTQGHYPKTVLVRRRTSQR